MEGFYKVLSDGTLSGGRTVYSSLFSLTDKDKDRIVDGWKWFNSDKEAREFYGLPVEYENEEVRKIQEEINILEARKEDILKTAEIKENEILIN